MPIMVTELDGGITRVILSDRMDAAGAAETGMEMYYVGESSDLVIVDLARVTFIASQGCAPGPADRRGGGPADRRRRHAHADIPGPGLRGRRPLGLAPARPA